MTTTTMINTNTGILSMIDDLSTSPINQDDDNRKMTLAGTYKSNDVEGVLYNNDTLKLKITLGNFVLTVSSDYVCGAIHLVDLKNVSEAYPYTTNFSWDQDMGITTDGKFTTQMSATSQKFDDNTIADVAQWLVDAQQAMSKATKIVREFIEA